MTALNLPLILAAAFISSASPGPATLAIAGASMHHGRGVGLATAFGVVAGSLDRVHASRLSGSDSAPSFAAADP